MNRKLSILASVAAVLAIGAGACKITYDMGEKNGIEEGRYAMRQHIDNVRWLKMFNSWADSYDVYAADTLKKMAAGQAVSAEDAEAVRLAPKIDREKTFGKIATMVKNGAGNDPLEANWLKVNGFSD